MNMLFYSSPLIIGPLYVFFEIYMHIYVYVNISDVYSSLYPFEVGKIIDILTSLVLKGIGENITIGKNMA